ncbi:MAG: multicopper oxidase domain-containing protein [Bauldia sp.]|nr:multicopper oxidase domain-containing protein [Bauldia sp.]MCW5777287.1 multicopper oxidase domain-containing protein [Phycisphaeraceae bacterium]
MPRPREGARLAASWRLSLKDAVPAPDEHPFWKDTVFVDGELELLMEFSAAAPSTAPFMFHCHVLEHEDRGMMGQYMVGG